jgi:putative acetyltransferase
MSVVPEHEQTGIGSSLVKEDLRQAREQGWDGRLHTRRPCLHERFGVRVDLAQGFSSPYAGPRFMALSLGAHTFRPAPAGSSTPPLSRA